VSNKLPTLKHFVAYATHPKFLKHTLQIKYVEITA